MILLAPLLGYLLGSIPTGLLLTRAARLGDIRQVGSGNIGATNVLRMGSKWLALATLLLDVLKGVVAVLGTDALVWRLAVGDGPMLPGGQLAAALLLPGLVAGLAAVLGHLFPVWLGFRGGKGVATGAGVLGASAVLVGVSWVGPAAALVWLAVAAATRISSAGALAACAAAPFLAWAAGSGLLAVFAGLIAALIIGKHRGNIRRLLAGTEPRIGASAAPAAPP
jgi:glycerol-3-phosphate acyltransferase PlsY